MGVGPVGVSVVVGIGVNGTRVGEGRGVAVRVTVGASVGKGVTVGASVGRGITVGVPVGSGVRVGTRVSVGRGITVAVGCASVAADVLGGGVGLEQFANRRGSTRQSFHAVWREGMWIIGETAFGPQER